MRGIDSEDELLLDPGELIEPGAAMEPWELIEPCEPMDPGEPLAGSWTCPLLFFCMDVQVFSACFMNSSRVSTPSRLVSALRCASAVWALAPVLGMSSAASAPLAINVPAIKQVSVLVM